jgi:probable F420-dependent oxidoreductase
MEETLMKLGLALPNLTPLGTRENNITFAQEAERLGYDSLWVTERLLYPVQPRQLQMGKPWPDVYRYALDPLDTLVFVAGVTEKIRLGTSVLDFPFYQPARLAKRIATLDVLSGGRAVIGAGLGWSEDEFIASGVPYNQRSGRFTEMIQAINALFGPDPVEFHGKYYHVPATIFNPKPLQKPRPPLLIGGFAPAALARAAKYADGFNPVAPPDGEKFKGFFPLVRKVWEEAGRGPEMPQIVVRVNHGYLTEKPIEGARLFLTGSVEQVREDMSKLAEWGASEVFFDVKRDFFQQPDGFQKMMAMVRRLRGVV